MSNYRLRKERQMAERRAKSAESRLAAARFVPFDYTVRGSSVSEPIETLGASYGVDICQAMRPGGTARALEYFSGHFAAMVGRMMLDRGWLTFTEIDNPDGSVTINGRARVLTSGRHPS